MSRCFPYPPPGYALSSAGNEALIESIKLQKEKVKAEEHTKKEKKREKKEKRKNKKENDKKSRNLGSSDIVHGHIGEKSWADAKVDFLHNGNKTEPEQLERSDLTEEHGKPVCLRLPSSSSDSTENSNKRKRQPSPVDVSRSHGKIIRIRLSSKKKNQSDASVYEQKHCSTSGRTHFPAQIDNDIALTQRNEGLCSTSGSASNVGPRLVLNTGGEHSKQIEIAAPALQTIALPAADAVTTTMSKEGFTYRNLIENWVPPQSQDVCFDDGDEDWLFGGKSKVEQPKKRSICRDDIMSCSNTSSLLPRAQYLLEVDIYALPFSVPF